MSAPIAASTRLRVDDPAAIGRLGDLFRSAEYNEPSILGLLKGGGGRGLDRSEFPLLLRRLPAQGKLPTLVRLFTLGVAVPVDVVARDCAPLTPDDLESLGLVELGPEGVIPRVRIHPYASLFVTSDPFVDDLKEFIPDYVVGMNATTAAVAAITVRKEVASALDLGTGQGVQAMLAARHCARVVATDINPRALNYAAFNAALNGVRNIEFREGSFFEPVKGETFDLIVCNPPYVISPETGLQFRDSGPGGDALSRSIVRGAPAHLNPGGFAIVRCNWALRNGETGTAPLEAWVKGLGCDTLLLHTMTESPLEYSACWNRLLLARRPEEFEVRMNRWIDFFQGQGIEGIGTGALVLRRRSEGAPWLRSEALPFQGDARSGELIARVFEASDWLATSPDPLAAAFSLAPELQMDVSSMIKEGRFSVFHVELGFVRGMRVNLSVELGTARILPSFDGKRTLGQIIESETPEVRERLVSDILRLFSLGYLVR